MITGQFLPIAQAVSIPHHLPRLVSPFRVIFVVFAALSAASLLRLSSPLWTPGSSAGCVLLSASAWAHILHRLCPLCSNVSQTPLPLQPHHAGAASSPTNLNVTQTHSNTLEKCHQPPSATLNSVSFTV